MSTQEVPGILERLPSYERVLAEIQANKAEARRLRQLLKCVQARQLEQVKSDD